MYPRLYKKLAIKAVEPAMRSSTGNEWTSKRTFSTTIPVKTIPVKMKQPRYKGGQSISLDQSVGSLSKGAEDSILNTSITVPDRFTVAPSGSHMRPMSAAAYATMPKMATAKKPRYGEPTGSRQIPQKQKEKA